MQNEISHSALRASRDEQARREQMNKPSGGIRFTHQSIRFLLTAIGIIIVGLLTFIINKTNNSIMNDYYISDGYQAIFVKGETYFGKVTNINKDVLVLETVYYLQDQQPLQSGPQPKESELALVKLGSEIHGPQNQMVIPLNSISYIENLKETSAIVRAIQKSE